MDHSINPLAFSLLILGALHSSEAKALGLKSGIVRTVLYFIVSLKAPNGSFLRQIRN